jgi:imidazolonepropionase-like amidohydrolase
MTPTEQVRITRGIERTISPQRGSVNSETSTIPDIAEAPMRASRSVLPITAGLLCLALATQPLPSDSASQDTGAGSIYIAHVTVVDTESGNESPDQTVVISGNRISQVKASKDVNPQAGSKVVDGTGKYLIPGLWDMHVHAVFSERLDSMLPMFVANGVLGIRDMGTSMPFADIDRLRHETADGSRLGPRIVVAGPILDGRPKPLRSNFLAITTPEQGRDAVRRLKTSGADLIKVYSWLSRDSFLAIIEEAKKQNIPVSGHVPFSVSALEASDAGQKSLEHLFGIYLSCSSREEELRSEMLKRGVNLSGSERIRLELDEAAASYDEGKAAKVFAHLARNGTWLVPTFTAVVLDSEIDVHVTTDPRLKYIPPAFQKRWTEAASAGAAIKSKSFERKLQVVGAGHRAGVTMLAGTDTAWYQPYTYAGFSLHDELALLVRAGLTPMESLQTATINPARFLGMEKDLGTIEKGKVANLVLLDADPVGDIRNTTKISEVFLGGKEFDRPALDQMLKSAEAAARSAMIN